MRDDSRGERRLMGLCNTSTPRWMRSRTCISIEFMRSSQEREKETNRGLRLVKTSLLDKVVKRRIISDRRSTCLRAHVGKYGWALVKHRRPGPNWRPGVRFKQLLETLDGSIWLFADVGGCMLCIVRHLRKLDNAIFASCSPNIEVMRVLFLAQTSNLGGRTYRRYECSSMGNCKRSLWAGSSKGWQRIYHRPSCRSPVEVFLAVLFPRYLRTSRRRRRHRRRSCRLRRFIHRLSFFERSAPTAWTVATMFRLEVFLSSEALLSARGDGPDDRTCRVSRQG